MFFKNLKVYQFRNLVQQEIEFSEGTNIFLGDNGQGKTNLIEAILFLSCGKSFRPANIEHMISWESVDKSVYLCAELKKENFNEKISYQFSQRSKLTKNDKTYSWSKLNKEIPYVLFSPESLSAIKLGPAERRNLMDQSLLLIDPNKSQVLKNFQKILRTRNKILSDYKNEKMPKNQALNLIESIKKPYIEACIELTLQRIHLLNKILPIYSEIAREILAEKDVEISVDYVISDQKANNWSENDIKKQQMKRLEDLNSAELATGMSLVGPHKHDIYFLYHGHDSRYYCSQGQQRALILSFKMAKIMYYKLSHGRWPFLFLDDVLSELDEEKRNRLIGFLRKSEGQTFITTTDLMFSQDLFDEGSRVFNVKHGVVTPR